MGTTAAVVVCPYCSAPAAVLTGAELYGKEFDHLRNNRFWRCAPCDAHVGCHPKTEVPLGTLANSRLRMKRIDAHKALDRLWDASASESRSLAYDWLSKVMNIPPVQCHIGMFTEEQCDEVILKCKGQATFPGKRYG